MHSASAIGHAHTTLVWRMDGSNVGFAKSFSGDFHGFLYSEAIDELQLLCHVQHAEVTDDDDGDGDGDDDVIDDGDCLCVSLAL